MMNDFACSFAVSGGYTHTWRPAEQDVTKLCYRLTSFAVSEYASICAMQATLWYILTIVCTT